MAGGGGHQVHHLDGPVGGNEQGRLAAVDGVQAAVDVAGAALEIRRRHPGRTPCRYRQGDLAAGLAVVVATAGDRHVHLVVARIDQAQPTLLSVVPRRIEDGNAVADGGFGRDVVHAGQKAILPGADVRQRLDVEFAAEEQKAPVAFTLSHALGQTLARVAVLEVVGIEVHRLVGADGQLRGTVLRSGIVEPVDAHRTPDFGVVDDPDETLSLVGIRGRHEQRDRVQAAGLVLLRQWRWKHRPEQGGGQQRPQPG